MEALLSSEERLLRRLYDEHMGPLLNYVRRLVGGDLARAEDVVQETMLRAWRRLDSDLAENPRGWLFRVAHNLVIDGYRAKGARPVEATDAGLEQTPAPESIDTELRSWQIVDALTALSVDHRTALVLVYYQGMSAAEAAARVGVPAGTMRSRIFYALRSLKLILEEQGVTA